MLSSPLRWIKWAGAQSILPALAIFILIIALFYHLGSAPAGFNHAEKISRDSAISIKAIHTNPINAPHQLLVLIFSKVKPGMHALLRLSSGLFATLFVLAFYYLARSWFGRTVGIFSTILFFTTPFFVIAARQASAEVMWLAPTLIMAIYAWLIRAQNNASLAWFCLVVATGLAIYVPGLIWWLLAAAIINRQKLITAISEVSQGFIGLSLLIFILILVPAGLAIGQHPDLAKSFALLPSHWPQPIQLAKNFGWMISSIFVKAPYHSPLIIARLPILNIIQIGLLVFGFYAMWSVARRKALSLVLAIALAIILAAINDNLNILLLSLPSMAIFMAAGLRYLYIEWRSVFPRNPIPKSLAMVLMAALVSVQLIFGLTYSLVAWPHTVDTKSTYVLK